MEWNPIILTFELAAVTSAILFLLALPLARWLAFGKGWLRPVVETLVAMPLVLPPTVLGFYLLLLFSPQFAFGRFLVEQLHLRFLFTFPGLVIGSLIYSLPFMVQPLQAGFSKIAPNLLDAARVMGKSPLTIFLRVILPNSRPALLTGLVLTFAHTIGEFGVVLMIGGNIAGETRVGSIAIYDQVELGNYGQANHYALVLFGITFSILLLVYLINGGYLKRLLK
ncbi:MAG: molybdate ABC transporter permease subunit [Bacteroidia bacterium]|nr:molybdate ABC transporter permease subunit [Bacteroidia bacterium]